MSNTDFEEPDAVEGEEQDTESVDEADADEVAVDAEDADTVETAAEDDGEEVDEPPKRGRANERIRTLTQTARDERERADRLDRELREEREARQRAQHQQRGETDQQIAERLALMTPEERSDYKVDVALEQLRRENAMTQVRLEDQADRSAFHAKTATDTLYAKWADKVEAARVNFMRQGQLIPREELFSWLIGQSVIAARGKNGKQRAKGQDAVRRQSVKTVNGKADARADRRAAGDTPAKRLEGVII